MGQYYTALVIDEQSNVARLSPKKFEEFFKLMEHAWIGNSFVNAAYSLIHNRRRQVAWIGDYSLEDYDPKRDAYAKALPQCQFWKFYHIAWGKLKVASALRKCDFTQADLDILMHDTKGMFLLNHSKGLFIDLAGYIKRSTDDEGWCANPLPLLTACGNNRGGGDFRAGIGFEHIGAWAFDWLEYTDQIPEGYNEFQVRFVEERKMVSLSAYLDSLLA